VNYEREEIYRAAKALKNDRAFDELVKRLVEKYTTDWRNSALDDLATREKAFLKILVLDELRSELDALASEPDVTAYNRRKLVN
jgi:predicted CopG family antitoxin